MANVRPAIISPQQMMVFYAASPDNRYHKVIAKKYARNTQSYYEAFK
ncbi:hypothetical protein CRENPOLYSF1_550059 [Crenothrix polyspora]|uniref:Uncharacterized protein n=1 Tax=Crenothrix polyspora TaxID=360316 RepID=A0A1R4HEZ1_9GAMM|nr:hypothetical protein CRENPOLYSF1_550059 [Crenothrix polyspora]